MTLGDMIDRVRRLIPQATVESFSDVVITQELNFAVDAVNRATQVYAGYTEFESVAEKQIYSLSEYVPNYLGLTKSGVWWEDAGGSFKYRVAKTIRWLDTYIPNWRDASSGEPFWYWVDGDDLGFYRKFSAVRTVRVYHLMKSKKMDNKDNYPWKNTTSEVTAFQSLDDAIIAYARWKLLPSVGKDETPEEAYYKRELKKGMIEVRRRKDLIADVDAVMRLSNSLA